MTLNAYASNNSNAYKLRGSDCDSVLLRTPRFVNTANHAENARFVVKNIVFAKMMVKGMRGIVKIPLHKVRSSNTVATMLKLAHHFLATLKNVDSVAFSGIEFSTFNPFVVGSTPARPTIEQCETPFAKVKGVFLFPCSTTKSLCEHFSIHAVVRRC